MDQAELIRRLKQRDKMALAILYDCYAAPLNGMLIQMVERKEVGEEILQDVFIKVWDEIDTYEPAKSTLFIWMFRICCQLAADKIGLKKYMPAKNNLKNLLILNTRRKNGVS